MLMDYLVHILEYLVLQYGIQDPTNVILVTREMLKNAAIHGNKNNQSRSVICRLKHLEGSLFRIEVEDEGDGFDYEHLDLKLPENPRHIDSRGYILINALSDRIDFNRKGNCVTVLVNAVDHLENENYYKEQQ
ncbi:hypothetical protein ES703_29728 [subsurface metagenome]